MSDAKKPDAKEAKEKIRDLTVKSHGAALVALDGKVDLVLERLDALTAAVDRLSTVCPDCPHRIPA